MEKESFKNKLGRVTWAFLHMLAKGYPIKASKQDKLYMKSLLDLLPSIYPCKMCSSHMKNMFKNNPYKLDGRDDFMMYMCRIHNIVNKRLGKDVFICDIENLEEIE